MPETMQGKTKCPSCGEDREPGEECQCPECRRHGCAYCMPHGPACECPECEDEEKENE